jgi:hypothetical protein
VAVDVTVTVTPGRAALLWSSTLPTTRDSVCWANPGAAIDSASTRDIKHFIWELLLHMGNIGSVTTGGNAVVTGWLNPGKLPRPRTTGAIEPPS